MPPPVGCSCSWQRRFGCWEHYIGNLKCKGLELHAAKVTCEQRKGPGFGVMPDACKRERGPISTWLRFLGIEQKAGGLRADE